MTIETLHKVFLKSKGASIDSREELKGKLFFALKGENFDGNEFAQEAIAQGAELAIVSHSTVARGAEEIVEVDDVLVTLQELANFHRRYLGIPIFAITGSNGKTTTKELISAVLSEKYVLKHTQGNLNNHIGVPLTLLSMNKYTEFGVVEMGANHQKEIEKLAAIAEPDFGYITNFGKAHLEGFGGFQGVIKGKSELYDFLKEHKGKVFVNGDDDLELKQSEGGDRITFGTSSTVDCVIAYLSPQPFAGLIFKGITIKSQLLGTYNAKNMAIAVCVGDYFGIPIEKIKAALEDYTPTNNRSQILKKGSNQILLDAYNANPTSMRLALENFLNYPAEKHVAILGDMFEIGATALEEHQKIVDFLETSSLDTAFVCGECFGATRTKGVFKFETYEQLAEELAAQKIIDAMILIKGSRGMKMERVLDIL